MRELPEGGRVQGAGRLERGVQPCRRPGGARGRHAFERQPRAVAELCRRAAGDCLHGGHAADRAAGQEGCRQGLRRAGGRMRALDQLARGGLCRGGGRDRGGVRPSLQRPAGDRRAGDLRARACRPGRGAGRRHRADRRRRDDLGLLPDAVHRRAGGRGSTPPSRSRPTTRRAVSAPGISLPTTRPRPWRTGSRCRSRTSPGIS